MAHGFFLVLEGPEAAGKSTLARALVTRLREHGIEPVLVREPGGTPVAEALRRELLDAHREWSPAMELLYLVTARADLVTNVIRPALNEGKTVLSDRYDLSTIAYQGAGRELPVEMVRWVNEAATGGLRPDLTLVLDADADVIRERQQRSGKGLDRMEREPAEFHARVAEAYRAAAGPGVHHLVGAASPDRVLDEAWRMMAAAHPAALRPVASS
ncbi:MAG: dTMP kinase [Gemmatimonadales bacterium]